MTNQQLLVQQLPFDISEASKSNTLISGQTHSGKTLLACAIASTLHNAGVQVIVVDPVGTWKRLSDLPYVTNDTSVIPDHSIIYSIEGLLIDQVKSFLEGLCQSLWNMRIRNDWSKKIVIILEEAEIYARNLRSSLSQELFRLSMSGRNLQIRLIYVTPRISNLATELIELAGQRYHGFSNEENSKRKLTRMYGKEIAEKAKTLNVGNFIYIHSNQQPRTVNIPLFKPTRTPLTMYSARNPTKQPTQIKTWIKRLIYLSIGLAIIWWILS